MAATRGLTSIEAAERLGTLGANALPEHEREGLWAQIWDVVSEPMLLLLLAAGTINFFIAEPLDGFMLMFFVLVVIGISIFEKHKSENALAALRELASPRSRVVRDGVEVSVPSRDLVIGDLVILGEGDRVPADGMISFATNLSVDESAMTGESVAVEKFETEPMFAGTLIVRGRAELTVTATAMQTELGKIGKALVEIQNDATPLQKEVNRLVLVVAGIAIAAAAVVAIVYALTRSDWISGLLAGIATAMAMLPEEFPVVLTIFMALGAWRMSKLHVLARRPLVIETLGTATVICTDKTGTLTTNRMEVDGFFDGEAQEVARFASLASAEKPIDPMDIAFRAKAAVPSDWQLVREYPLEKDLLAVTHVWQTPTGELVVASKGAPEAIAKLTGTAVSNQLDALTGKGLRVLAVASDTHIGDLPEKPQGFRLNYLGLAGLKDPLRPNVREAVAECARAGIRTIMITGDYPNTALAIANELGLDTEFGALTGNDVDSLGDDELAARLINVNVFARMVPEQKLRIVRALQANGDVVAMTGDGVNDAPALRASDIGIAMGLRGTDVAREAADLILTDDDFGSIERGIHQGRGIFANLRKAMAYIVSVHIPLLGMSLIPVFMGAGPIVLVPLLIAVVELIVDPACSVIFQAEQIPPNILREKPRKLGEPIFKAKVLLIAIAQGLSSLLAITVVYLWALASGNAPESVRTVTFIAVIASNVALILTNRSWHLNLFTALLRRKNPSLKWLALAVVAMIGLIMAIPAVRDAFSLTSISGLQWLVAIASGYLGVAWFEVYKTLKRKTPA